MFVIKLMYILSLLSVVSLNELLPENHPDYLCNKCSVRYYATSIFNSECIEDVPCPEFMLNAEDSAQSEPVTAYLGEFYISLTGYQDSRKKLRNSVGVGAKRLNGMARGEMGQRNSGEVAYCQLCNIEHRGDIWVIYTCEDKECPLIMKGYQLSNPPAKIKWQSFDSYCHGLPDNQKSRFTCYQPNEMVQ